MWVIKRTDGCQPAYVAYPGHKNSYTNKLQYARTFPSYEKAKADCCGNEHPVRVEDTINCRGED
jgi:hypothetical protein